MNIAYLILAHSDPLELRFLCERLSKSSDIFIHINRKSKISEFERQIDELDTKDNIKFIKKRENVHWGGIQL